MCPDGLTYDEQLGMCVDDTTKSTCGGIAHRVHVRMWSWDCGSRQDDVVDAAIWAARRLEPAWQMLYQMLYAYQHYGAPGRAWARAMWDGAGQAHETAFPKFAIGDFNEYRLGLGVNTIYHALRKITDSPWLVLCHDGHCVNEFGAHTLYGTIYLCPPWFAGTATAEDRGKNFLHETLHWSNPLWLYRTLRDVENPGCHGWSKNRCYGDENANYLRQRPEIRVRIFDQQLGHDVSLPASVVNNDNWKRWLITRFEHFGCAVMPPGAPNVQDFE